MYTLNQVGKHLAELEEAWLVQALVREDGLTQALEEVSALLVAHFPLAEGQRGANELPNAPVVL